MNDGPEILPLLGVSNHCCCCQHLDRSFKSICDHGKEAVPFVVVDEIIGILSGSHDNPLIIGMLFSCDSSSSSYNNQSFSELIVFS